MVRNRALAAIAALGTTLIVGSIASAAVKSGSYTGTNSEGGTVTLKITGHKLEQLKTDIGYDDKCGAGGGPGYAVDANRVTITNKGKFSARVKLVSFDTGVATVPGSLTGKATGDKVTGKIVDMSADLLHAKCNGYIETFSAVPKAG